MESVEDKLVRIGELSTRLGVPVLWLKDQADAGRIPCIKTERGLLFSFVAAKKAIMRLARRGGAV